MHREFSILRMKADAATWEYPLSWDEVAVALSEIWSKQGVTLVAPRGVAMGKVA